MLVNNLSLQQIDAINAIDEDNERYDTDIFTDASIKGKLGVNTMKAKKHLFDHIVYDSSNEHALFRA